MLQHALFTLPNYREGYTIDDNARALMVSVLADELGHSEGSEIVSRYLAFICYAFNGETKRFRNFMDYRRNWLEASGSDDSHGRTLWALGTLLGRSNTPGLQSMAGRLFEQALPAILTTTSPRAWAFALIGIHEYLRRYDGDRRASGGETRVGFWRCANERAEAQAVAREIESVLAQGEARIDRICVAIPPGGSRERTIAAALEERRVDRKSVV